MAKKKQQKALDDILEDYTPPHKEPGYLGKVSPEVLEFIRRTVGKYRKGELAEKFKNLSSLSVWMYKTLKQEKPDGFPKVSPKHFTEVLKNIDA